MDISSTIPNLLTNKVDNEYEQKVILFEKLIKATFPNLDFNIIYNNTIELYLPLYSTKMSISKTNNWIEIKKRIEFTIYEFSFEIFKSIYDIYMKSIKYDKKDTDICDFRKLTCILSISKFSQKNNKIYIKDSNIHGKGIFAKENIKKGTIITLYPPHYVVLYPDGRISENNGMVTKRVWKSNIVENNNLEYNDAQHIPYEFMIDENFSICGDRQLINDMNFVGHMSNDGVNYSFKNDYNKKDLNLYTKLDIKKNNSKIDIIDDIYVVIITTKDINIDDEILTRYGYDYWMRKKNMLL